MIAVAGKVVVVEHRSSSWSSSSLLLAASAFANLVSRGGKPSHDLLHLIREINKVSLPASLFGSGTSEVAGSRDSVPSQLSDLFKLTISA